MRPPQRSESHHGPPGTAAGIAVVTLLFGVALAAGRWVGFHMEIPYHYYQLLDAPLLLAHPGESLLLLHGQPPGLNVLFYAVLWLGQLPGVAPELVAAVLFAVVGWASACLLFLLVRDLSGSTAAGLLGAAALVASPGFHVFGNLFFYSFLLQLMLLALCWLAWRWLRHGGTELLLAIVLLLAAICLTRTLFHPLWALACLGLLAAMRARLAPGGVRWRLDREGRGWLAAAALLSVLLLLWPLKNWLVHGRFIYSSWHGINLTFTLPISGNQELASLIRRGAVSPGMARRLEELTRDRSEVARQILLSPAKSDGSRNWNHLMFLLADEDLARRAIAWRLEHPGTWAAKGVAQYLMWSRPTWVQPYSGEDLGPPHPAWRAWSGVWQATLFRDVRGLVEPLVPLPAVHRQAVIRGRPIPYPLAGVWVFPLLLVTAAAFVVRGLRRRRPAAGVAALAWLCVVWNLAVPAATFGSEGNRMRFSVAALMLLLGFWVLAELVAVTRTVRTAGR